MEGSPLICCAGFLVARRASSDRIDEQRAAVLVVDVDAQASAGGLVLGGWLVCVCLFAMLYACVVYVVCCYLSSVDCIIPRHVDYVVILM